MRSSSLLFLGLLTGATGCARNSMPQTLGELSSGYGYVPLDGLQVFQGFDEFSCYRDHKKTAADPNPIHEWRPLAASLPDVTVRFAVANSDGSAGLSYGPAKLTSEGHTYRAVVDYVNVDAVAVPFYVRKRVKSRTTPASLESTRGVMAEVDTTKEDLLGYDAHVYYGLTPDSDPTVASWVRNGFEPLSIPVYVGLGLRITADVRALKSNLALTGLGVLGAEASANGLTGTLLVQTIGVSGGAIATALPLPSKIDETTIENAILAVGSSRSLIYGTAQDNVSRTVRIVGMYSPVYPDPRLINVLYSELAHASPTWYRPCGAGDR